MEITITATEANRQFSKILRGVREGKRYTITSHGEVVADIVPRKGAADAEAARQRRARVDLKKHLDAQPVRNIGRWTRDEAYDESQGRDA